MLCRQEMGYPFEFISENTLIRHIIRTESQRLQNECIGAGINGYEYTCRELNALHRAAAHLNAGVGTAQASKVLRTHRFAHRKHQLTAYTQVAQCKADTPTSRV